MGERMAESCYTFWDFCIRHRMMLWSRMRLDLVARSIVSVCTWLICESCLGIDWWRRYVGLRYNKWVRNWTLSATIEILVITLSWGLALLKNETALSSIINSHWKKLTFEWTPFKPSVPWNPSQCLELSGSPWAWTFSIGLSAPIATIGFPNCISVGPRPFRKSRSASKTPNKVNKFFRQGSTPTLPWVREKSSTSSFCGWFNANAIAYQNTY